jgi:hypothetical protein
LIGKHIFLERILDPTRVAVEVVEMKEGRVRF